MASFQVQPGFFFPKQFWTAEAQNIFTPALINFLIQLHQDFEPERKSLLQED